MIADFANQGTQDVYVGDDTKAARATLPKELWEKAAKKLFLLHAAGAVGDLKIPPSNNLEKLKGNRAGQWSIRINDKYRICFTFEGGNASGVEVVDYH